ncbi:MAG: hypothetical protein M5U28_16780 [Sandaracinaceae bacterium]|nr:hypothetical protein [Sandaracinaceae bacterium]
MVLVQAAGAPAERELHRHDPPARVRPVEALAEALVGAARVGREPQPHERDVGPVLRRELEGEVHHAGRGHARAQRGHAPLGVADAERVPLGVDALLEGRPAHAARIGRGGIVPPRVAAGREAELDPHRGGGHGEGAVGALHRDPQRVRLDPQRRAIVAHGQALGSALAGVLARLDRRVARGEREGEEDRRGARAHAGHSVRHRSGRERARAHTVDGGSRAPRGGRGARAWCASTGAGRGGRTLRAMRGDPAVLERLIGYVGIELTVHRAPA